MPLPFHPYQITPSAFKENGGNTPVPFNSLLKILFFSQPEIIRCFNSIFQGGFLFPCQIGSSIEDLLENQLSLKPKFIEKKVNTVFLDARCVDNISSAILREGSVIALSSALPGLVGATLRRGGVYASLRDPITHRQKGKPEALMNGVITVKLFNLLIGELGKVFLEKGIVLSRSAALDLFKTKDFRDQVDAIRVQGKPVSRDKLLGENFLTEHEQIMIRVLIKIGSPPI